MKETKEPTFPLKTSKCISEFTEIYFTNTYLKAEAEAAVLVGRKTSQAMEKYFSFGSLRLQSLRNLLFQLKRLHVGHQFLSQF